jgi:hypothetical protein
MFETLPNPSLEMVLMTGRAVLLIGAFWIFALAFARWRRADDRSNALLQAQLERTFAEVRSLHEAVTVISARLEAVTERNDMDARLAPAGGVSSPRGYDVATRLARNGAGASELTASCGVTRHEAELLVRLHGAKGREATAAVPRNSRHQDERPANVSRPVAAAPIHKEAAPASAPAATRKRGSLLSVVG